MDTLLRRPRRDGAVVSLRRRHGPGPSRPRGPGVYRRGGRAAAGGTAAGECVGMAVPRRRARRRGHALGADPARRQAGGLPRPTAGDARDAASASDCGPFAPWPPPGRSTCSAKAPHGTIGRGGPDDAGPRTAPMDVRRSVVRRMSQREAQVPRLNRSSHDRHHRRTRRSGKEHGRPSVGRAAGVPLPRYRRNVSGGGVGGLAARGRLGSAGAIGPVGPATADRGRGSRILLDGEDVTEAVRTRK